MNRLPRSIVAMGLLAGIMCVVNDRNANAQTATSTLVGTVVDDTGAVVPGATVTATHMATTTVRNGTSNEAGLFRIPALAPGEYSLAIELSGFKSVTVQQIQLVSSETRDLGRLALEVGTQAESVTVTAEVTPVQVASSERGATVTGDQLQNIQLKGRDIFGFASILPGVLDTNTSRDFTTWTSMRDVSINGAPWGSKNVLLDGISIIDEGANQNAFVNPNIDAVAEVRVLSNGFQAEHGRNSGGTISIVTKGGTNQLRGSVWYNARRDKWNANDFISNSKGLEKPLYKVNISGYSVGGPVLIPKLLTGDGVKLFFFGSQEFTSDARPVETVIANLPTEAERRGDFSNTRQTNGALLVIRDPQTGQPFPGNVISQDRIDSLGRALLNLLPLPNGYTDPRPGQQFVANFQNQQSPEHNRRNDVLRIDAELTASTRFNVKYMHYKEETLTFNQIAPGVGGVLNFVPGWVLSGNLNQVLSGTMVNELTVGFGHNNFGNRRPDGFDYEDYFRSSTLDPPRLRPFGEAGPPGVIAGLQNDEWPYLPTLTFAGGNRANLAGFFPGTRVNASRVLPQANRNDRISLQDDLSKTMGRHNLKTGIYVEYSSKTEPTVGTNYMGNFNFGSNVTNPLDTGYGYANALLGVFQTYTESTNRLNPDLRQWQIEGYVQDSWRIHPRLTLDFGVRITHNGPYTEKYTNAGFFPELWNSASVPRLYEPICLSGVPGNQTCPAADRAAIDRATGSTVSFAYVGNVVPGSGDLINGIKAGGRSGKGDYYDYPTLVPAPRVGFAWDVNGDSKTALRASAGVFHNRIGASSYGAFRGQPPTSYDKVIRNATINEIPNLANATVDSPISIGVAGGEREVERAYEWNVALQRDLGFSTVVEIAYIGNLVRHSQQNLELNPIPLYAYGDPKNLFNNAAVSPNFLRQQYPGLGSLSEAVTDVASLDYHGLQISAQRRLHAGLQLGAAYTLSKAEGIQGWDPYTSAEGEDALRERYWGPTSTDRRHVLNVNYSYEIPNLFPTVRGLSALFGDWQISGITKYISGAAAQPTCSSNNAGVVNSDPSLTGFTTNSITGVRCELVGDPYSGMTSGGDPTTAVQFNTAAFAMAQPLSATVGNFGNTPIGILRLPSWSNWDMTLAKRIRAGRANVRLQFQAYNVFNQVQFTTIGTTYTFTGPNNSVNNNSETGRYTAVNPGRQLGITARVEF